MQTFRRAAVRVAGRAVQVRMINTPHGGKLVDRMVSDKAEAEDLVKQCDNNTVELNVRQSCDVELLMGGAFSPLHGFMDEGNYDSVVDNMKLSDGLLFSIPVVMDTNRTDLKPGMKIALNYKSDGVDPGGVMAVMEIDSMWKPNKVKEVKNLYGTSELEHPGVLMVAQERGQYYIGGKIHGIRRPQREFPCMTPAEVRATLPETGDIAVFQCRNPVHRAHYELFTRALDAANVEKGSIVLVHPTCGPTQADDISGAVRYLTYEKLKEETKDPRVRWAYMPYSMHMAGPREAIQHMMLRKNYGCTHFIIGRDMAGSKSSITGEDYYGAYDAQEFAQKHGPELGMNTIPSLNLVCSDNGYITAEEAKEKGIKALKLSGTEFRRRLRAGEDIPEWFAFKSVVDVLRANI